MPARALKMVPFQWIVAPWFIGSGNGSTYSPVPDGYLVECEDAKATAWQAYPPAGNVRPSEFQGREDLDFIMECSWQSGKETNAFGLLLGVDEKTFHAFCVSRNNGVIIVRYADGAYRSAPMPWKIYTAAAVDRAPITRIVVSKRGDRYEMAVNGTPVGCFTDETRVPVTHVGVFVDDAQSIVLALAP